MSAPYDQKYFDWCASHESEGWHIVSVAVKAINGTMGHTEPKVAGPLDTTNYYSCVVPHCCYWL